MSKIRLLQQIARSFFAFPIFKRNHLKTISPKDVVLITGCDSGLGFNLAIFCHSLNMTVISGCFNINSEGAKLLQKICNSNRLIQIELDIRNRRSIQNANSIVKNLFDSDETYKFSALINNAAVMCFGEFEWQTYSLFENQIETNLLGPMKVTKEFLPLLRQHHGRIINITSHCGFQSLPGLSAYGASKGGLRFWNDAIRIELKKYNIDVVNFVPGSFFMSSNILAKQEIHSDEMKNEMTNEQIEFYGDYFERYNQYLKMISGYKTPSVMNDRFLLEKFKCALLDIYPNPVYCHQPIRYGIYHFLMKIAPIPIRDWLCERFVSMPDYRGVKEN